MSRYMRFAVCAVLGFGVLALLMSNTDAPQSKTHTQMQHILAQVDAQMETEKVAAQPKVIRPTAPKLNAQARRARDLRAERREERSVRLLEEEFPASDTVTVRELGSR